VINYSVPRFLVASGMDKILDITQIDKYARTGLVK
jgi:hypothetical protein